MEEETISLIDDEGNEKDYEVVIRFDIEDKEYVLLSEDEESDDVYAFLITEDEEGQVLMQVEDEAEFALVAEAYDELMDEMDEEDDDEGKTE
ncbi:DUF1292 domain-containing protein [Acetobacterium paludosum]|uniref:UPF0473 protein GH810_01405 n=2 Tax=Acetobacterium paludosum TaxID=52693 RepID=A0A923KW57_9FIRM|nr:DUF1292 domain-containing protein [Acetobacterium paludosum]